MSSGGGGEMRGFVFAISFILIFSGLLATIPTGFQGTESTLSELIPIDPNIVTDFSSGTAYQKDNFTYAATLALYEYTFDSKDWLAIVDENVIYDYYRFSLGSKIIYFGILWLGQYDYVSFTSVNGDRGPYLGFDEIDTDADEGVARYTMQHITSGSTAGGLIAYWNTTTYDNSTHAWDNDGLNLLHGVGFESSATNDIGALLVSLLFLQLPSVPVLVNLFLAVPIWSSIVYVLWFIIKEMIPFV